MGFLSINRNLLSSCKSKLKSLSSSSFSSSDLCCIRRIHSRIFSPEAVRGTTNAKKAHAPTVVGDLNSENKPPMFLIQHSYNRTSYSLLSAEKIHNNNNSWKLDNIYCPFPGEDHFLESGGCNGFYLVVEPDLSPGESLWYPKTNKIKTIPRSQVPCSRYSSNDTRTYVDIYGFGFDSASSDYKVIRFLEYAYMDSHPFIRMLVELYSLNTNSWKEITYPYPEFLPKHPCVHINGNKR